MAKFELNINDEIHSVAVDADKPLLWVLREEVGLTGTKYGCGIGQCGACTVHIDGTPARSCGMAVSSIGKNKITTIEGLAEDQNHPVLKAWEEENVPQCGYCQTGQIMSAAALLEKNPSPSEKEIEKAMDGNFCRCGTYYRIRKAIYKSIENTVETVCMANSKSIMDKMKFVFLLFGLILMNFGIAQESSFNRDTDYYKDWVGEWYEVIDGKTNALPSFVVTKSLYDAAFEEIWMGKGGDFGKAWRAWDGRTKKWDFAWISTDGLFQLWEGKKENGVWYMHKYFILDDGQEVLSRQAFIVTDATNMTRTSEHSRDNGKTWKVRFEEIYIKQ